MLSGRQAAGDSDSYTPAPKVGAAAATPAKTEGFEDFPEALDSEEDDLPF